MVDVNIPLILAAGLIASLSPGPATLAIAGTSMERGRLQGVVIALGIFSGSITWSISAAVSALPSSSFAWMHSKCRYANSEGMCLVSKSAGFFSPRTFRYEICPDTLTS